MDAKVNYTVVGLFVVVLSIVLIYVIFWLTAGVSAKDYKTYLAYMSESVSGLSIQSPVKYNGVQVGYVDAISLKPHDPSQVRLVLNIEADVPIREDTTATIETQGLTGIAYVGLRGGSPNTPLLTTLPDNEYPVIATRPSLFLRLDIALKNLTTNLDSVTSGLKAILDEHNQIKIKQTLDNLAHITQVLAQNSESLNDSIKNFAITMKNTASASQDFPQLIEESKQSLIAIKTMANNVSTAGRQISVTMQKGRTTLDTLNNQLSPQLYSTLQNFSDLSQHLKTLTKELEQTPSMLIVGKTQAAPGPGEVVR